MIQDIVDRLHLALVQALRSRGPDALERPITVAEIYQDLIPYRTARAVAGIELNADYEHALLRLFAGEGDRVRLEPQAAREELRRELESPNPNVALYRKFAACDAWITVPPELAKKPGASPASGAAQGGRPAASAGASGGPVAAPASEAAPPSAAVKPAAGAEATKPVQGKDPAAPAATGAAAGACAFCGQHLPSGRPVRFCPYCGTDQSKIPCARCGEVLESGWRFCIGCGTPAAVPAGPGKP